MKGQTNILVIVLIFLAFILVGGVVGFRAKPLVSTIGPQGSLDMQYYIDTYGFDTPTQVSPLSPDIFAQLRAMTPHAIRGTAAYDQHFHETVPPQLIVWWSYADALAGIVSYSNCNGSHESPSSYNCPTPQSGGWQLGYGTQFAATPALLDPAFLDLYGNNDAATVQAVGNGVLKIDGVAQNFPAQSVTQLVSQTSTSVERPGNLPVAIVSRDPDINSYINADALRKSVFNRDIVLSGAWGSSYTPAVWQEYSNKLAQILQAWPQLVQ